VSRQDAIKIEGAVVEVFNERLYRVEFQNGHRVIAHLAGRADGVVRGAGSVLGGSDERNRPRAPRPTLDVGDKVTVEMSPFDFSRGRICSSDGK
jgi:translation initiation factor IF-1